MTTPTEPSPIAAFKYTVTNYVWHSNGECKKVTFKQIYIPSLKLIVDQKGKISACDRCPYSKEQNPKFIQLPSNYVKTIYNIAQTTLELEQETEKMHLELKSFWKK